MPEAPELEVAREFLAERIVGESIERAEVIKPSVLRPLAAGLVPDVVGRAVTGLERRGKFLIFGLSDDRRLVVNPMLTGGFQYCPPSERLFKKTCLLFELSNGRQLRYLDDRQMGRVYYVSESQVGQVPELATQGPDAMAPMDLEEFRERLGKFRGEIKGVLTRGRVVSGIGNAYADEVLFEAQNIPLQEVRPTLRRRAPPAARRSQERAGRRGTVSAGAHGRPHSRQEPGLPEGAQSGAASPAPAAATRSARSPPTGASPAIAAGVSRGCSYRGSPPPQPRHPCPSCPSCPSMSASHE